MKEAAAPPDPSEGSGMKEAAAIQRRTPSPGSESSTSVMNVSQESFTFSPPPKPATINPAPQELQAQQELIGTPNYDSKRFSPQSVTTYNTSLRHITYFNYISPQSEIHQVVMITS
jgi:hypothetical protein